MQEDQIMAIIALHSAATGLSALSTNIDVIANNLANATNVGFKASRVNFEDLLYEEKAQPGVENSKGDARPAGLYVGLGTQVSNTQIDFRQGSAITTDDQYDMMIDGQGFFQVDIPDDIGQGIGYTRTGHFFRNNEGDLVLGTRGGPRLIPNINVPESIARIAVGDNGTVTGFDGTGEGTELGQIQLAIFVNPHGLKQTGGNVYVETDGSGPAIEGVPTEAGFGAISQGHLEASNVNPVRELIDLIKTQRAFEMNSQSIQAADEALQVIANLKRF
jgi:flagellar basal-body rod protein FlgG